MPALGVWPPASHCSHVCIARQGPARLAGGMAGLRRLIGGGPRGEAGDAHAAAAAAAARAEATAETGVALGLAAFAVSAFVKSVLCPALSAYTPRVSTVSLARHTFSSHYCLRGRVCFPLVPVPGSAAVSW